MVCVSSPGQQLQEFAHDEGIVAHPIPMERRIRPLRDLRSLVALVLLFYRLRPTVVHTHTPKAGLLGMIAAWVTRVPVRVFHVHGLPVVTATGLQRRVLTVTDRLSARIAHRVLFVSASLRDAAVDLGVAPAGKSGVLGAGSANGIDADHRFNPSVWRSQRSHLRLAEGIAPSDLVIGFVGRMVRDKGLTDLMSAWETLRSPGRRLLLVGPAEQGDPLPRQLLDDIADDPDVRWIAWTSTPEAMMSLMDVLVLPSYREGLPLSLLEASAMAIPVVSTDIPGGRDAVIDGLTGTLVPVRAPQRLAEAIEAYLTDPALRTRHGIAGRNRVLESFQPVVIWEALAYEYRALLQPHGPHTTGIPR